MNQQNWVTRVCLLLFAVIVFLTIIGSAFGQTLPPVQSLPQRFSIVAEVTASAGRPLSYEVDEVQASVWLSTQWGQFPIGFTNCFEWANYPKQLCAEKDGVVKFNPEWLKDDIFNYGTLSLEVWASGRLVQRVPVPRPHGGVSNVSTVKVPDSPVSVEVVAVTSVGGRIGFTAFVHKIVPNPLPVVVRAYVSTAGGGDPYAEVEVRPKRISAQVDDSGVVTAYLYTTEFEYSVKLPEYVPVGRFVSIRTLVEDPNDPFTKWGQAYNWTQK